MSRSEAQTCKEEGNKYFQMKKFDRAIECYTKCIELDPNNSIYFSNRSACYHGIADYRSMVHDAKQCILLDPNFSKGYFRLYKGLMELNRFGKAYQVLFDALNNRQLNQSREERAMFESELEKCIRKLQDEQAVLEKTQELINPFSNMNNLNSSLRIEMEMRRDYYLNHFVTKEHKIIIIEKLDDLLKAMKSVVKKVGNLDKSQQSNDSTITEKDGKIMLGEKEQDLINEEFNNRALPTSCLNWRYQVEHISPIMNELQNMGIGFLEICAVILVYFVRPEISFTLLKRMIKNGNDSVFLTNGNDKMAHAYVLLAQSYLFWIGVPRREIGLSSTDNKPLQYLRSALSLLEKIEKKNYNPTANHILIWTYINLIQQCCSNGDEMRLPTDELESLMNDFYQILFILDSSEVSEYSLMNSICQDGIRFWLVHLQSQLGALDQFQRVSFLPDHEVVSVIEKIFNECHSANLPLPKHCLNKFFLHALSESLLLRNNLEGFLRNIRLSLLSIAQVNVSSGKKQAFLEKSMHYLHYAIALQSFHNRYCFKKTDNERNLLRNCIERFDEIVTSYDFSTCTKLNLLESLELHDLFLVISMYGSVADLCKSFSQFCSITHLHHRDYPYLLTKLLNQTVKIPRKIKSLSTSQSNEGGILLDYYEKSLSIISDEDSLAKSNNLITSTLKINKEMEWINSNEYWSQGFDKEQVKVLLIKDAIGLSDLKKYTQRYQSCSLTSIETSSDLHFAFLKEVLKSGEVSLLRANTCDSSLNESFSGNVFDVLETNIHLFKQEQSLQDLIQNNLREGAIVKLSLPSLHLAKFVKSVRNFLIQSLPTVDLFERDEFDNIPKLKRAPTRDELSRARDVLSLPSSPFTEQFSKLAEFYNLNSFADLIFSPLWNDNLDENNKNGFSFEKMYQYVEKVLGLKIISLSTSLMPFQGILKEYIEETKDIKLKDWKTMDTFAKSNSSYFTSPIHVLCEKPVKRVDISVVDKKKDPLGLKKYLHKFSNK